MVTWFPLDSHFRALFIYSGRQVAGSMFNIWGTMCVFCVGKLSAV